MNKDIYLIGIDEAGRGCLIGDMVVAGVVITERVARELSEAGVTDSKQLSIDQRFWYYNLALRMKPCVVEVYVPPWRIDRENINKLEVEAITWIVKTIEKIISRSSNVEVEVYIDEVKGRELTLDMIVRKAMGNRLKTLRIEPDADSKFTPVSIASVFAKVSRDQSIKSIKRIVGDFGSGYPADPRLESWIMNAKMVFKKPPRFIRRSWSNLKVTAPEWFREKKPGAIRSLLEFLRR